MGLLACPAADTLNVLKAVKPTKAKEQRFLAALMALLSERTGESLSAVEIQKYEELLYPKQAPLFNP